MRDRLVARQNPARHRLVLLRELGHLRLDRREILGSERALVGEVVIEAVLDDRTDRHLRVGKELLHRVSEQVSRRMADQLEPVGSLSVTIASFSSCSMRKLVSTTRLALPSPMRPPSAALASPGRSTRRLPRPSPVRGIRGASRRALDRDHVSTLQE
jgi:hypothetical protein